MADATDKDAAPSGGGWLGGRTQLGAIAIVALAVLGAIYMLLKSADGPWEIALDRDGSVKVAVQSGSNFADIVASAIEKDPRTVEALLSNHAYYNINSPRLVDALARLDAAAEVNRDVTAGIRKLLWNLDGPFKGPGTLSDADERFMLALEELDKPVFEVGDKGKLIIELWERSLERESPLGVRTFSATVVPVRSQAAESTLVFFCTGPKLANKGITVFNASGGLIIGVMAEDTRRRLPCGEGRVTLEQLFAGQPLTLGIDPASYGRLADPQGTGEDLPRQVDAFFEVQPAQLTAIIGTPK